MNTEQVRPRVADLVFHLFGRPLHPELFETLAVRRVRREDYDLTVRLTRTGHVITWSNARTALTEVTAVLGQELPPSRLLGRRLVGEHTDSFSGAPGVSYQTSSQIEVLPEELFRQVHEEILADGLKRGLFHNFRPHHRLALAPVSLVTSEAWTGCLLLSTFHTFPDEWTVLKTQTLIERR